MSKDSALRLIKALHDAIADVPDPAGTEWVNDVLEHLAKAADVIEFPRITL